MVRIAATQGCDFGWGGQGGDLPPLNLKNSDFCVFAHNI